MTTQQKIHSQRTQTWECEEQQTERKRTEQSREQSVAQFKAAFDGTRAFCLLFGDHFTAFALTSDTQDCHFSTECLQQSCTDLEGAAPTQTAHKAARKGPAPLSRAL